MKKSDLILILIFALIFFPFIVSPDLQQWYREVNHEWPYLMSFIKFFVLATLGEVLGLRIRKGGYALKGFGLIPRALVWGMLGISIKMAFVIFGVGAPYMLESMGIQFGQSSPATILDQDFFSHFSWLQLLAAFSVSLTLNVFFAPVFMTVHKITDSHIERNGGSLRGFFTPLKVKEIISTMNWKVQWGFVFKKTIPLFWIPAQTLNFLLPGEYRVLVAAIYSVILGVILAIAAQMGKE